MKQNTKNKKEKTAVEPTLYTLPAHFPEQRTPDSPAPGWMTNKGHGLWQKEVHLLTQLHPNLQQSVHRGAQIGNRNGNNLPITVGTDTGA